MKKTLLTLLVAVSAATAVAAPVMAQPPGFERPGGWDIDRRINWIQERINRGRGDGSLDRHEFYRVQGELNSVRREERGMRAHHFGHLDDGDRAVLEGRLNQIGDQIHWIREHNDHRPW